MAFDVKKDWPVIVGGVVIVGGIGLAMQSQASTGLAQTTAALPSTTPAPTSSTTDPALLSSVFGEYLQYSLQKAQVDASTTIANEQLAAEELASTTTFIGQSQQVVAQANAAAAYANAQPKQTFWTWLGQTADQFLAAWSTAGFPSLGGSSGGGGGSSTSGGAYTPPNPSPYPVIA